VLSGVRLAIPPINDRPGMLSFSEWPRLWNLPFYAIVIASMLALLVLGSILASGWWRVGCALLAGVYLALAIRGMKSYVPTTFSNSA